MASENRPSSHPESSSLTGRAYLLLLLGLAVLAVLFVIGILPHLHRNEQLAHDIKEATEAQPSIQVMNPLPARNTDLSLPGTTEAIEDTVIGVRTSGYIRKLYVDIGRRVHAGQVLAEIESPDVDQQLYQADAQTAQAQASVRQAQATVSNSKATVAQFQSNVQQAVANLEQTRALVADAQAKLAQSAAAKSVSDAQLTAAQHQVDIQDAALKQAQTQLHLAEVTLQRYETLLKQGYVAMEDVDQNRATYDNAVSAVNSAKASLAAAVANVKAAESTVQSSEANVHAGEAELKAAEKSMNAMAATVRSNQATVDAAIANVRMNESNVNANEYAVRANKANTRHYAVLTSFEKVIAPYDGVITARNVEVGTLVSGGSGSGGGSSPPTSSSNSVGSVANVGSAATSSSATPNTAPGGGLFGIARPEILRIFVSLPEAYVRQMHAGLPAQVELTAYPGHMFPGAVARMSGALDVTSRTLLTEVQVDNRDGKILPGMYVRVHFDLARQQGALRIPASALIYDAQGTRVAVVTPENRIHYVPVTIGRDYGQVLEVTQGITGQDALVVNPTDELSEGEAVNPAVVAPPSYMNIGSTPDSGHGQPSIPGRQGPSPLPGPGR